MSSRNSSALAFGVADRVDTRLIGGASADGSFELRRPRGLATAPRVLVLRGRVLPGDVGAEVDAGFAFHPAVRVAIGGWVAILVLFAVVVAPGVSSHPELLWVPVTIALIVGLMCVPFAWFARDDRASLRTELEAALRRAGSVTIAQDSSRPAP